MLFYKPTNTSILGQERAEAQIDRGSGKQGEEAECQAIAAQTPHRPQLNHMHTNTFTPVYSPLYSNMNQIHQFRVSPSRLDLVI